MISPLLTPEQVVTMLALDSDGCNMDVALERLRNLRRCRRIPYVRLSPRKIRFRASDIETYLERVTTQALCGAGV